MQFLNAETIYFWKINVVNSHSLQSEHSETAFKVHLPICVIKLPKSSTWPTDYTAHDLEDPQFGNLWKVGVARSEEEKKEVPRRVVPEIESGGKKKGGSLTFFSYQRFPHCIGRSTINGIN